MKPLTAAFIAFGILLTIFGIFLTQPGHIGYAAIQETPSIGTALAGSGVSIMIIAALSEPRWKKMHEEEVKNMTDLMKELYGKFDEFMVAYSDKLLGGRLASHKELNEFIEKYGEQLRPQIDRDIREAEEMYGVKPHPYKTTIILPTYEACRYGLRKEYEELNKMIEEGYTKEEMMTSYKRIQSMTDQLKNLDMVNMAVISHEIGHEVAHKRQPELLKDELESINEGVATGIGFIYLLNKAKKGDVKKEDMLDFIETLIEGYRFHPENDPHRIGLYVLGDFDPSADKSLDDMMEYLLKRVNAAMEDPRKALKEILSMESQ